MEYPNITVIASMPSKDLLEMVIMHEVGHNWFYGILGSNERYYTWMDEGLNDYSNIRYWQDKHEDANEKVRKFLNFVELPCNIITGKSPEMKKIVEDIVIEYGWQCRHPDGFNLGAFVVTEE